MYSRKGKKEDQYKQVYLSKETCELLDFACEIEHISKQTLVNKILKKKLKKIMTKYGEEAISSQCYNDDLI